MKISIFIRVFAIIAFAVLPGCDNFLKTGKYRFLSPDKPIAKPETNQLNWIIASMGELDKTDDIYPNATRPGPSDWIYEDTDYIIGPTDVLDVSILDLYADGMETLLRREVSDSGYIDLPQIKNRILASGMTHVQLTDEIKNVYRQNNILRDPVVSVTVAARRQATFSILGSVIRPGSYNLMRRDMRLMDAMALSGGITQSNIEYLYVIRHAPAIKQSAAGEAGQLPSPDPARRTFPQPAKRDANSELKHIQDLMEGPGDKTPTEAPARQPEPMALVHFTETANAPPFVETSHQFQTPTTGSAGDNQAEKTYRWAYKDGQWVRVEKTDDKSQQGRSDNLLEITPAAAPAVAVPQPRLQLLPVAEPTKKEPVIAPARAIPAPADVPTRQLQGYHATPKAQDPYGWGEIEKANLVRVIAINIKKLEQGDWRQNIVIRENDVIQIPSIQVGEFYIMGEVLRPGVYSMTGRKITLKQAVAAAGNLGPLSWPENSILIRRIGKNQEQVIPINLEKILRGTDPDVYLKANDVIAVGTHWSSTFLAVMRNAFRMTYGFGFIYDKNFAENPDGNRYPNSKRFKGW